MVVEEDLEFEKGIAEDGSGATRATAIATEIRLLDQLIVDFGHELEDSS